MATCVAIPVVSCACKWESSSHIHQPGVGTTRWAPAAKRKKPHVLELLEAAAMYNSPQHSYHLCKEKLTVCLHLLIVSHQGLESGYPQKKKEGRR